MATEMVTVKEEPIDLSDRSEYVEPTEKMDDFVEPEFVNIKIDPDSIMPEPSDLQSLTSQSSSWNASEAGKTEVVVKIEPNFTDDEDDDDPDTADNSDTMDAPDTMGATDSTNDSGRGQETNISLIEKQLASSEKNYCIICEKSLANSASLQRHLLTCHAEEKYPCDHPECMRVFLTPGQLEKHQSRHKTPDERNFCVICQRPFKNFKRHLATHVEKKYNCTHPGCTLDFPTKTLLEQHLVTHRQNQIFKCEICEKQFKTFAYLTQHKRAHMTDRPYECSACHRRFAFKSNLARHQGNNSCELMNEPIKCEVCNKSFRKEFLLKSHMRKHITEKPYECADCHMHFKYKSTLLRHTTVHNGSKPYPCPFCDKTFTHYGLLKPHLRVHTGEKPYACPICGKVFAHKHNMERHADRHKRIKHLVCKVCHKEFPKESRLKYHMRTHSNEKYFSCHICPKKFSHKQNVLRHYSRKHPNATYTCPDTDASVALKVWDSFKSEYGLCEAEAILG